MLALPCPAQTVADSRSDLPDILAGIIHYTRWPTAPETVRLCLNERDADAPMISRFFDAGYKDLPRVNVVFRRIQPETADALKDCHAVYFGHMAAAEASAVLMTLGKWPVLTVGFGDDFCSYAGLFCLIAHAGGYRIAANLDSISRNGIRVNPLLLKLTVREGRGRT